ncbi:MAG TPA: hypothetical protein VET87_18650 [Rubrivivax sp.]|jgi:bifunctional DNA-binding transcriptional regulator/antitoxin component of YhaV-PrlF toxin-antitoxin module|nr:hypothetical protein [Rubrivivax sp.]
MRTLHVHESSIDGQGRTTIPVAVRVHLGVAARALLEWAVLPGRLLKVNVKVEPVQPAASAPRRDTGGLPR